MCEACQRVPNACDRQFGIQGPFEPGHLDHPSPSVRGIVISPEAARFCLHLRSLCFASLLSRWPSAMACFAHYIALAQVC